MYFYLCPLLLWSSNLDFTSLWSGLLSLIETFPSPFGEKHINVYWPFSHQHLLWSLLEWVISIIGQRETAWREKLTNAVFPFFNSHSWHLTHFPRLRWCFYIVCLWGARAGIACWTRAARRWHLHSKANGMPESACVSCFVWPVRSGPGASPC